MATIGFNFLSPQNVFSALDFSPFPCHSIDPVIDINFKKEVSAFDPYKNKSTHCGLCVGIWIYKIGEQECNSNSVQETSLLSQLVPPSYNFSKPFPTSLSSIFLRTTQQHINFFHSPGKEIQLCLCLSQNLVLSLCHHFQLEDEKPQKRSIKANFYSGYA